MTELPGFSPLEFRLLNEYQRDFPLMPYPFRALAAQLGSREPVVLATLNRLQQARALSRVGPVFRPGVFGDYVVDTAVLLLFATLGFRYYRTRQMTNNYYWLYEKASPFSWKSK